MNCIQKPKCVPICVALFALVIALEIIFSFTVLPSSFKILNSEKLGNFLKDKSFNLAPSNDQSLQENSTGGHFTLLLKDTNTSLSKAQTFIRNGGGILLQSTLLPRRNTTVSKGPHINVGFYEGYRKTWLYSRIFLAPEPSRMCTCKHDGITFTTSVSLEKNATRTGRFDILFIPQDVGFSRVKNTVWDVILSKSSPTQRRLYATFEGANKLKFLALRPPYKKTIFHWSWTYHSKSDFPMPYGYYALKSPTYFVKNTTSSVRQTEPNWARRKTKLMAWMSTWSSTSWKRAAFVKKLQTYLSVDCFGEKLKKCPRNTPMCEQTLRKYKFYLALENSCCSEYITEKFWRTLAWDIVPVVVGAPRVEYERHAPPNSFIYADDYDTMEDLADYILYLDKNDNEYNRYFHWKVEGNVVLNYPPIQNHIVKHHIPPETFFYSCTAVCRVSRKYIEEVNVVTEETSSSSFDPGVSWWYNSCTTCGQHAWISMA